MSFADATSPAVACGGLVLVPVGSVEQHGPHLPLDTDTVVAAAVAAELAPLTGGVVAPAVAYGASGEHQSFPGTVSIGTEVLAATLVELGRSLTVWAARVLFVNGHGGNVAALRQAVSVLRAEGRDADWVPCVLPPQAHGDAHAGRTETSLMLHLRPDRVRMREAGPGNTRPLADLMPAMLAGGVAAVSPNGVLGDPTGATAEEGATILRAMVAGAYDRVTAGADR
ncbi:mycofactocin biosynthesis peptidyl-dipeptidase MftE [Streptomyces sp. JW3]|uniref:mycofactocin biosynthesis peptidyl-dipeptidase MftE n=1 Tax=Streptomyces sp. JW3 TaxID=3456955 RepID=UPI003FA46516